MSDLARYREHFLAGQADRTLEIEPRGHTLGASAPASAAAMFMIFGPRVIDELCDAVQRGGLPFTERVWLPPFRGSACVFCGEDEFETDGVTLYPSSDCPYPDGIAVSVELPVLSGRMIVGSDLRPEFDDDRWFDLNVAEGIMQRVKAMAEIGCAHLFVGNTCPGVYRTGPDELAVASAGFQPEQPGRLRLEIDGRQVDGEAVAGVTTDLWWVSVVDGDEFDRRGASQQVQEISVTPGVYRFDYYRLLKSFKDDCEQPMLFAKVSLIAPAD